MSQAASMQPGAAATELADLDASSRWPVLAFYTTAVVWLVVGLILALIASLKLAWPDFLGGAGFTFGRVWPAASYALGYGWASLAGIGTALWITTRLTRAPFRKGQLPLLASLLWNFAVLSGTFGILAGYGTSIEWLDAPSSVVPCYVLAFGLLGSWVLDAVRSRRESSLYVSQWYVLTALLVFPLIFLASSWLLFAAPTKGLPQAAFHAWFQHNVFGLWLLPLGVATILYLLPKLVGRPLAGYSLSVFGFWAFALFYNAIGPVDLPRGPLPTWLALYSAFGVVMLVIAALIFLGNTQLTLSKNLGQVKFSPTLRFLAAGTLALLVLLALSAIQSIPIVRRLVAFTQFQTAYRDLALLGFFSMVMFAAIYYVVPRVNGWQWSSSTAIIGHFWSWTIGVVVASVGLGLAGLAQGQAISDAKVPFLDILTDLHPFFIARVAALGLMLFGAVVFGILLSQNMLKLGEEKSEPTLLAASEQHHGPLPANVIYRNVFLSLPLVLVAETAIAMLLSKLPILPLALVLGALALLYVFLVGWYLMYVRSEGRWIFFMLTPTCIMAVLLVLALIPDIVFGPRSVDPIVANMTAAAAAEE